MHPLAKRISLLVSVFSLVLGLFLLGYNLRVISDTAKSIALSLWPVLMVLAGIMLVIDSVKKRRFTRVSSTTTRKFPIHIEKASRELSCRVQFSYGRLVLGPAPGEPLLVTEHAGPAIPPQISQETVGGLAEISIAMSQPLFPRIFNRRMRGGWSCPGRFPSRCRFSSMPQICTWTCANWTWSHWTSQRTPGRRRSCSVRPARS